MRSAGIPAPTPAARLGADRKLPARLLGALALSAAGAVVAHPAVEASGSAASSSALVSTAREYLLRQMRRARPDVTRFELTALGRPVHPTSPGLAPTIAANAGHGTRLARRACVWVQIKRPDGTSGALPVWFAVKAFRDVLVAQHHLQAHEAPHAGDFAAQEQDVAPLGGVPVRVDTDFAGLRTRRTISAGHTLLSEDMESQPQIQSGQSVEVTVRLGSVAIETSAVALREARLGEWVSLRNPGSQLDYLARVVGQGQAAVVRP
jgi:flagella basal body P-ring formation protein FlgA